MWIYIIKKWFSKEMRRPCRSKRWKILLFFGVWIVVCITIWPWLPGSNLDNSDTRLFHLPHQRHVESLDSAHGEVENEAKRLIRDSLLKLGHSRKRILLWNNNFDMEEGNKVFQELDCPVRNCDIVYGDYFLNYSDAVVFDAKEMIFDPPKKPRDQVWIFFNMDSPRTTNGISTYQIWDGLFNYTMTYRRDSDIQILYGKTEKRKSQLSVDYREKVKTQHRELVASVVNDKCATDSKRHEYVQELRKHITIDIFGKCGNKNISCESYNNAHSCLQLLSKKYKFFLVFEDSFCKDYLTQTIFEVLSYDIVPVVRGLADYAKLAPPGSFINVKDFKSPIRLARHLEYLDKNPEKYAAYFAWKNNYVLTAYTKISKLPVWCQLCAKLNDKSKKPKNYRQIDKWWNNPRHCQDPEDLYVMF